MSATEGTIAVLSAKAVEYAKNVAYILVVGEPLNIAGFTDNGGGAVCPRRNVNRLCSYRVGRGLFSVGSSAPTRDSRISAVSRKKIPVTVLKLNIRRVSLHVRYLYSYTEH